MIILSIETSCDETAVSLVEASGELKSPHFSVLGNALYSQVALHTEYGGVYPNLAKREHGKNLVPLLEKCLKEAEFLNSNVKAQISKENKEKMREILVKENNLGDAIIEFLENTEKPKIDMIAVTAGPGLEPALWVGVSFSKALSLAWNVPVVPTNHMKGHIASVLLNRTKEEIQFPAIALLISGGHTEIVYIEKWGSYSILGQTRDDAVGEAFDKVARMLELPYPGGPEISKLAQKARDEKISKQVGLPRPMIHSKDLNFSFSGLKTAVLYTLRDLKTLLTEEIKMDIAREFEDAVIDVLVSKTEKALIESNAQTLIIAGGVIANKRIRETFFELLTKKYPQVSLEIPELNLSTDNAVMIAMASYIEVLLHPEILTNSSETVIHAQGNLHF